MQSKQIYESGTKAAIQAGMEINSREEIHSSERAKFFLTPEGFELTQIKDLNEKPDRKTGSRIFTSNASFNSYVNKHKNSDETIIIADADQPRVRAIFNDNGATSPAWGDFSADLNLSFSTEWRKWTELNGVLMSQEGFAQFIEDNRGDFMCGGERKFDGEMSEVINPSEFKKLVLDLNLSISEKIKSKLDIVTGDLVCSYSNEESGDKTFKMPKFFVILVPIYKSGDYFSVIVRMRRRAAEGKIRFGFQLDQVDNTIEAAFKKVCTRITDGQNKGKDADDKGEEFEGTGVEVLLGPLS